MSNTGSLPYRKLIKKLKKFGISVYTNKGKGSEVMLIKEEIKGSGIGPQYPVKHHGDNCEIYKPVISAILRRFDIPSKDFWK